MIESLDTDPVAIDTAPAEGVTWENSPIAQVYNPDGSPREGALEKMTELGHGDSAKWALNNGQDIFTALKNGKESTTALRTRQEAAEGSITPPGEDATDEDRAAFAQALGVNANADEVAKAIFPEELPEGFQKDEALAGILAKHAAENPVNTPESLQKLAIAYMGHQDSQIKDFEAKQLEESNQAAQALQDKLKLEAGGEQEFAKFADGIKQFLISEAGQQYGFQFNGEKDGDKLTVKSDNPLHQAMLNDEAGLRALSALAEKHRPAGLPGSTPAGMSQQSADDKARELLQRNPDGWKSSADYAEYQRLRGLS